MSMRPTAELAFRDQWHIVVLEESRDALLRRVTNGRQVVATLERQDQASVSHALEVTGHEAKGGGRDGVAAQGSWMAGSRVKASCHDHEFRVEVPCDREDKGSKGGQVLRIPASRISAAVPRDVHVEPHAILDAHLRRIPGPREEVAVVVTMDREVEDARICVEDLLDAVAVMHVPVKDEDALDVREAREHLLHGDGNRVEEAKAHRLLHLSVMSRRTDDGEAVPDLPSHDPRHQFRHASGSRSCGGRRVQLVPRGIRVHANAPTGKGDEGLDRQICQATGVQLLSIQG